MENFQIWEIGRKRNEEKWTEPIGSLCVVDSQEKWEERGWDYLKK